MQRQPGRKSARGEFRAGLGNYALALAARPDAKHPGEADHPRLALDFGRPGLLDQLDHRPRHRNVAEFLGHFAAVGVLLKKRQLPSACPHSI